MQKELAEVIEDTGRAFEAFKSVNDKRIEKLEKGQPTEEDLVKIKAISKELDELGAVKSQLEDFLKKQARAEVGGGDTNPNAREHKAAFGKFLRKGVTEGLPELEKKALSVGSDPDGGFAVPETLDRSIVEIERNSVAMRSICNVIQLGNENYSKLANLGGAASGWVGETDPRPETDSPKLESFSLSFGELYANPCSTQKMLDDSFFDAEAWLASEVAFEFAEKENAAFVLGDGSKKPKGLLAYGVSDKADHARDFGVLQALSSGAAGAITADALLDLVYSLKRGYRNNAKWLMSSTALCEIRKLKDDQGNYLWRPGLDAGEPSTLLSREIAEEDAMPDIAADALAIAFGDFKRGYTIADFHGIRVLRDPYTRKSFIHFYTTKRVGGGLMDSNAIKLMKIGA